MLYTPLENLFYCEQKYSTFSETLACYTHRWKTYSIANKNIRLLQKHRHVIHTVGKLILLRTKIFDFCRNTGMLYTPLENLFYCEQKYSTFAETQACYIHRWKTYSIANKNIRLLQKHRHVIHTVEKLILLRTKIFDFFRNTGMLYTPLENLFYCEQKYSTFSETQACYTHRWKTYSIANKNIRLFQKHRHVIHTVGKLILLRTKL